MARYEVSVWIGKHTITVDAEDADEAVDRAVEALSIFELVEDATFEAREVDDVRV